MPDNDPARTNDDSSSTILQRFSDVAREHGWSKKTDPEKYAEKRRRYIADEVRRIFSDKFDKMDPLQAWRILCETIEIPGAQYFGSVRECKEARRDKFVNIVDLVDAMTAGKTCKPFTSEKALRDYIYETEKVYPLGAAKYHGLLKEFLIQVGPLPKKKGGGGGGSRRPRRNRRRPRRFVRLRRKKTTA